MISFYKEMKVLIEETQDLLLAQDPSSDPKKLVDLYDNSKNRIPKANMFLGKDYIQNRRDVAATHQELAQHLANNPNLPVQKLLELGAEGHNIFNNSSWPLHLLENPQILNKYPKHVYQTLLGGHPVPKNIQSILAEHPDEQVRWALYNHDSLDPEIEKHMKNHSHFSNYKAVMI